MNKLGYRFVDADQHLYEPPDAYSRHLEKKYHDRMITQQPGDAPGARRWSFDGQAFLPDHYERVMGPGTWKRLLAHTGGGLSWESDDAVIHPYEYPKFVDRDARLAWMDERNFEATVMIPTSACDALGGCGDMPRLYAHMRSYNRHLEDDWGYRYQNRIFAVPQLTLDDLALALEELERLIRAGAKFVLIPPRGTATNRSPGDPCFDPFWERLVEADVVPLVHLTGGSAPLWEYLGHWGELVTTYPSSDAGTIKLTAFQNYVAYLDRPCMDFVSALILHNLFGRFPALRMMIVENGIGWVPYLLLQMDKAYRISYDNEWLGGRPDLPSEVFKRHLYITPFLGDQIPEMMDLLGPGHVMLGSDYPHPEGAAEPSDYLEQLADQPESRVRSFMRDTAAELYGLSP